MSRVAAPTVLLALVALAAAGSLAWFGFIADGAPKARTAKAAAVADYQPVAQDAPAVCAETWAPPPAQSRGAEWIYDVFTPPEIFYDARTKQFSITPPQLEPMEPVAAVKVPFGVEVVAVKRPLFRLQLVGFVGQEGHYRGLFENTATTETFLAAAGRRLPALGLTIEDLTVARVAVALPDAMTTRQLTATASLRDERSGEHVTLNSRERLAAGAPVATLKLGDGGELREVRAGEQIEVDARVYQIEAIALEPAAVTITRRAPDLPDETQTLMPAASPTATP